MNTGLANPNKVRNHTTISITKKEYAVVVEATNIQNRLYGTNITPKDFVREAISQKIARLKDEELENDE